jgi:ribosomal-protein-serine acetyltransferase
MLTCKIGPEAELRLLEPHHAKVVFEAVDADRGHLREWLPWVDLTAYVEDTEAFITTSLEDFAKGANLVTGIWCEGQFAGTIGCHRFDLVNRKTEIGYWLGKRWEGRGLVTAGCRALLGYLFCERELERVEIRAATRNTKSRAIPERLGFREEGVLRHAQRLSGGWVDLVIYGMLRQEWISAKDVERRL